MGADDVGKPWVGRAKPPPPPVDPYWPPPEPEIVYIPVPPPRRKRTGRIIALVVVGLFGLCCVGAATLAWSLTGGRGSSAIGPAPPGLNSPVRDGRLEFVVTAVSCGHATVGRLITRKAQGQFCIVDVSVSNIGTKAQAFADSFQKLIAADGKEYSADTTAGVIANESGTTIWNNLNPGAKVTGKMVYDIPKDAIVSKVELHDSPFSTGATITL